MAELLRLHPLAHTEDAARGRGCRPARRVLHGEPDGDLFRTGLKVVIPNEGSPLQKDAFDSETEFLKLDDFKIWLKKYNLKSS